MSKIEKWLGAVVVALIMLIVIMLLVVQSDDGAVLISDDTGTLSIIAGVIVVALVVAGDTLKSRNFTDGYGRLIDKLTSDVILTDAIESNYLAMPEGLPRSAVDLFADIAKHLVLMTKTDRDDRLSVWLDQVRDGKPNEG